MSKIEWNEHTLPNLGRGFLRRVIDNMRGHAESVVRFGETGQGVQPNYQVVFPNGVTRALRGSSHEGFEQTEEFNPDNISMPFNLAAIKNAYDNA